jgi:hypothetical protein
VTEPSSDTPVVMPPGVLSGVSGQAQACMPQAANSLSPHHLQLVGVFCSSPVQPGSTAAELSPATPVVRCFQGRLHDPGSSVSPSLAGEFLFQAAAPAVASAAIGREGPEVPGLAVLTDHQQAQGKHRNECRGTQLEITDRQTLPVSIFYGKGDTAFATVIPSG